MLKVSHRHWLVWVSAALVAIGCTADRDLELLPGVGEPCSQSEGCYGENVECRSPEGPLGAGTGRCECEPGYNNTGFECLSDRDLGTVSDSGRGAFLRLRKCSGGPSGS